MGESGMKLCIWCRELIWKNDDRQFGFIGGECEICGCQLKIVEISNVTFHETQRMTMVYCLKVKNEKAL